MKLLIEIPTWLGDAVMATSAIENITNYYDDPEITLIGSFVSIEALKNNPKVAEVHILEKKYLNLFKLAKKLGNFDVFFSFRNSFRAKLLKLLVSSTNKYQFNKNHYKNCHQVEKYNSFVSDCLKTNFLAKKISIYPDISEITSENSMSIMGINPGASYGDAKRWSPYEFAKVAAALSNRYDILLFGGPGEEDIAADIEKLLIEKGINNFKNLAGNTTIQELINAISSLDLFITGDSGPMHIAGSFQIPTIAIFGPTNDKETSQWMNTYSIIIKKNLSCQPCMKRTCHLKHHNCMRLIEAQEVIDSVPLVFTPRT
jgi:heptosyltransferase II